MRIPLTESIRRCTEGLREQGCSATVVKEYRAIWWQYYGSLGSAKVFGPSTAERFLKAKAESANKETGRGAVSSNYIHAMNLLSEYSDSKKRWQRSDFSDNKTLRKKPEGSKRKNKLSDPLACKLDKGFYGYLADLGYAQSSITGYEVIARGFLHWLKPRRLHAGINQSLVNGFIEHAAPSHVGSTHTLGSAIRMFLRYLDFIGMVDGANLFVPSIPAPKKRIPEYLCIEEQASLLSSFDTSTEKGARDYAMVLLAIRTGLRSCDILNLRHEEINWRDLTISITQKKTGAPLMIPLPIDVARAIAFYIGVHKEGRASGTVFLGSKGVGIPRSYPIARKALDQARVRIGHPKRGFHLFRFTFTANMIADGVPIDTLSNLLGHAKKDSSIPYISYAQEELRCCALPLSDIPLGEVVSHGRN